MRIKFSVVRTTTLPSANVFAVEGRLSEGTLNPGDILFRSDSPEKFVKIKSIALVNEREPTQTITLSVERPAFPIEELNGFDLVAAD